MNISDINKFISDRTLKDIIYINNIILSRTLKEIIYINLNAEDYKYLKPGSISNIYNPLIDIYPVVTCRKDIDANILALIKKHGNSPLVHGNTAVIDTLFDHKIDKIYIELQLDSYVITMGYNNLNLHIIRREIDNIYIHIQNINSSREYTGTWLMGLANALIFSLGIKKAQLVDKSTMKCTNDGYTRLIFLRVFQGKYSSWYENFGYKTKLQIEDAGHNANNIDIMYKIDNFPMSIIKQYNNNNNDNNKMKLFGNYVKTDYNTDREYDDMEADLMKRINNTSHVILGDFMTNLWNSDCHLYKYFMNILTNSNFLNNGDFNLSGGLNTISINMSNNVMFRSF